MNEKKGNKPNQTLHQNVASRRLVSSPLPLPLSHQLIPIPRHASTLPRLKHSIGGLIRPVARARAIRHPFLGNAQGAATVCKRRLLARGGVHDLCHQPLGRGGDSVSPSCAWPFAPRRYVLPGCRGRRSISPTRVNAIGQLHSRPHHRRAQGYQGNCIRAGGPPRTRSRSVAKPHRALAGGDSCPGLYLIRAPFARQSGSPINDMCDCDCGPFERQYSLAGFTHHSLPTWS